MPSASTKWAHYATIPQPSTFKTGKGGVREEVKSPGKAIAHTDSDPQDYEAHDSAHLHLDHPEHKYAAALHTAHALEYASEGNNKLVGHHLTHAMHHLTSASKKAGEGHEDTPVYDNALNKLKDISSSKNVSQTMLQSFPKTQSMENEFDPSAETFTLKEKVKTGIKDKVQRMMSKIE